jgi:hypothetical protein
MVERSELGVVSRLEIKEKQVELEVVVSHEYLHSIMLPNLIEKDRDTKIFCVCHEEHRAEQTAFLLWVLPRAGRLGQTS